MPCLASEKGYHKLMEALKALPNITTSKTTSDFKVQEWKQLCYDALNDDFNTPILIAHLFDAVKHINLIKEGKATISEIDHNELKSIMETFVFDILGIQHPDQKNEGQNDAFDGVVQLLINLRNDARANKDFETSDKIRDQLLALGIQLKDGKDGTTFSLN